MRSLAGEPFHVELAGSGKQMAVTRVSSGGTAQDLKKALDRAGSQAWGKSEELRVLRVPAMHLSAVWLHHSNRLGADMFIPYTDNFVGLRVGRAYTQPRIERALKQYATHMILRWYEGYEKTITQPKTSDFSKWKKLSHLLGLIGTSVHPVHAHRGH